MRIDVALDSLYVLSSLWGGMAGAPVCSSSSAPVPRFTAEAASSIRLTAPAEVTAFVGVNVVPMDTDRVLANQTVLVENGLITAVGPSGTVKVPERAIRVDGRGKYLMPGLADLHAHVPRSRDVEGHMFSYVAHGVTTIRQIYTVTDQARMQLQTEVSPRLYLAKLYLDGPEAVVKLGIHPDSVEAYLTAYKAAGYNFISMSAEYAGETDPRFNAFLATARRLGIPLSSHTNGESLEGARALGLRGGSVDHLYLFRDILARPERDVSMSEIQALAAAARPAWITVTLVCTEYNKRPTGSSLTTARRIVKALQDAGANLLVGSDANGGVGSSGSIVHDELRAFVAAGLSPYQALRAGTYKVAEHFGVLDSSGTVAPRKWADLVLLYGNPLQDIEYTREPAGVMIKGRWLDRAALDEGLLASPSFWWQTEVRYGTMPRIAAENIFRITGEWGDVREYLYTMGGLADSLEQAKSAGPAGAAEYQRMLQHMTRELGALRASMTPAQRVAFDPRARVWMREHARQGHRVTIPGVPPTP